MGRDRHGSKKDFERELNKDEPALNLSEVNLQAPDSTGWRRYQIITFVRNDGFAEQWRDLGAATQFKADQFRIPGGVIEESKVLLLHTVGELEEIAEFLRSQPSQMNQKESPDLIHRYYDQQDKKKLWVNKRSIFGPNYRRQRNG